MSPPTASAIAPPTTVRLEAAAGSLDRPAAGMPPTNTNGRGARPEAQSPTRAKEEEEDIVTSAVDVPEGSQASIAPPPAVLPREPAFELVVLGCGGGPLETDCSGYLLKPAASRWEDGVISLEGGSGIGALAGHIERHSAEKLFPSVKFPPSYNTSVLKAAYIFSYLSCYLITHAHLDHAVSLIILSGSVPPRLPDVNVLEASISTDTVSAPKDTRIPVYAMRSTLDNLSAAYAGGLWPELGAWAVEPERGRSGRLRKRRKMGGDALEHDVGVGAMFSPLMESPSFSQLHPSLPFSTKVYPLLHGNTSQGCYHSSAVFFRYDPSMLSPSVPPSRSASQSRVGTPAPYLGHRGSLGSLGSISLNGVDDSIHPDTPVGREFLFFGDFESEHRTEGRETFDANGGKLAGRLNLNIWRQAAASFTQGRLAGLFIECSYDSSRPAELMFGHLSPPAIFHELKTLVSLLPSSPRPLEDLTVFITHIKEFLVPHPSGLTARELIAAQLTELEREHAFGVEFVIPAPGDRLLI